MHGSLGVAIFDAESYLSFDACVVSAQKNRLIEMAVLGTINFCMGVEIFLCAKSYLSFYYSIIS